MLGLALAHPRTPWYAKVLAVVVVAYAVSPIDLIPDPIPVLGYLDDIVLLPLGVALVVKLIPPNVVEDCRQRVTKAGGPSRRLRWAGAVVIALLWLFLLLWLGHWAYRFWAGARR